MSLLHGEVRPTCSANGQKVAIIGTLTLPSHEVLETITGSFIPSAQLRDGSLFLDFIRPCKYGRLKFYLTHTHTLQSKQQPFFFTHALS